MKKNMRFNIAACTGIIVGIIYILVVEFSFGFKSQYTVYCHGDDPFPDLFSKARSLKPGECIPAIKRSSGWPLVNYIEWLTPNGEHITRLNRSFRPNAGVDIVNYIPAFAIGVPTGIGVYKLLGRRHKSQK